MDCIHFEELLGRYLDQELSEEEASEFHAHEMTCSCCAEKVKIFQNAMRAAAQDEEIPAECAENWRRTIKWESSPQRRIKKYRRIMTIAAVVVLLLAGVGLWSNMGGGHKQKTAERATSLTQGSADSNELQQPAAANAPMPSSAAGDSSFSAKGAGISEAAPQSTAAPQSDSTNQMMLNGTYDNTAGDVWTVVCDNPGDTAKKLVSWAEGNSSLVSFIPDENRVILHLENVNELEQWLNGYNISSRQSQKSVSGNIAEEINVQFVTPK